MQQTHLEVNTSNTREQSLGLSNTENQKPSTPSEDSTRCLAIGSSQRSRTGSQGLSSSHSGNPRQPQSRFLRPSATRAARPGRGRGREGDARQPSGSRSSLRSPEPPSGCWTAPTPARPCPGSPPSRNSRARAARGRSRGPAAPWSRALRYLWRRGSPGRRRQSGGARPARSWPTVRCLEPALSLPAARRPRSSPPLHLSTPTFPLPLRRPPHVLPAACACAIWLCQRLGVAPWRSPTTQPLEEDLQLPRCLEMEKGGKCPLGILTAHSRKVTKNTHERLMFYAL